jgi:hypothetical protein
MNPEDPDSTPFEQALFHDIPDLPIGLHDSRGRITDTPDSKGMTPQTGYISLENANSCHV